MPIPNPVFPCTSAAFNNKSTHHHHLKQLSSRHSCAAIVEADEDVAISSRFSLAMPATAATSTSSTTTTIQYRRKNNVVSKEIASQRIRNRLSASLEGMQQLEWLRNRHRKMIDDIRAHFVANGGASPSTRSSLIEVKSDNFTADSIKHEAQGSYTSCVSCPTDLESHRSSVSVDSGFLSLHGHPETTTMMTQSDQCSLLYKSVSSVATVLDDVVDNGSVLQLCNFKAAAATTAAAQKQLLSSAPLTVGSSKYSTRRFSVTVRSRSPPPPAIVSVRPRSICAYPVPVSSSPDAQLQNNDVLDHHLYLNSVFVRSEQPKRGSYVSCIDVSTTTTNVGTALSTSSTVKCNNNQIYRANPVYLDIPMATRSTTTSTTSASSSSPKLIQRLSPTATKKRSGSIGEDLADLWRQAAKSATETSAANNIKKQGSRSSLVRRISVASTGSSRHTLHSNLSRSTSSQSSDSTKSSAHSQQHRHQHLKYNNKVLAEKQWKESEVL